VVGPTAWSSTAVPWVVVAAIATETVEVGGSPPRFSGRASLRRHDVMGARLSFVQNEICLISPYQVPRRSGRPATVFDRAPLFAAALVVRAEPNPGFELDL
jgi:hypothetical protein